MKFKMKVGAFKPFKGSKDSIGWDLRTMTDFSLKVGEIKVIPLGLFSELPPGIHAIMKERSGLATRGLEIHGGVIDNDYRGEWMVILRNGGNEMIVFSVGDKVAQFILVEEVISTVEIVSDLGETDRGEGGFGSTGK